MFEWWGPILHEYYGGTELNGLTYVGPADWLAHPGTGRSASATKAARSENELILHPKVEDVAVVGVPHEEFGEEVKAVARNRATT